MLLLVGLGNPGDEYTNTPHNVGFAALQALHDYLEKNNYSPTPWALDKKVNARMARCKVNEHQMILAQPQTFMNLSGSSVKLLTTHYSTIPLSNLLITHDDIDLVQGTVRIRNNGSSAGHKGVQNIIDALGTQEFARIRIGVRPNIEFKGDTTAFVLKKMSKATQNLFENVSKATTKLIMEILEKGIKEKTTAI